MPCLRRATSICCGGRENANEVRPTSATWIVEVLEGFGAFLAALTRTLKRRSPLGVSVVSFPPFSSLASQLFLGELRSVFSLVLSEALVRLRCLQSFHSLFSAGARENSLPVWLRSFGRSAVAHPLQQ